MKAQNNIPAKEAKSKAEVIEWIFAQMFSCEPLPEGVKNEIRSFLADGRDSELKIEALGNAFLKSFYSIEPAPVSAYGAREWSRLAEAIGLNTDINCYLAMHANRLPDSKIVEPRRHRRTALRVAAVLVPAALIAGGYLGYERWSGETELTTHRSALAAAPLMTTIPAHADSVRHIILADGTEVLLNRNSALSYNDDRTAELSGEAYFKITRDSLHPFVIRSDKINVSVLGTEFNFNTDADDGTSKLSLYSGTVEIDHAGETDRLDAAGEEFTLDRETNAAEVSGFDATHKPFWVIEAENPFNIIAMSAIFDQIEAAYGVTIVGREWIDMNKRLNFTLDLANSIENVMSVVEFSHGEFGYTINGNTVTLNKR